MKKIVFISTGIISVIVIISAVYYHYDSRPASEKSFAAKGVENFALPAPEDIVLDEETGLKVVKDVIMITFSREVEQSFIDNIIKGINGKVIGSDMGHNLYQVKIPGANLKDIQSKKLELMTRYRQEVEMAAIETVSAARNPGWENRISEGAVTE